MVVIGLTVYEETLYTFRNLFTTQKGPTAIFLVDAGVPFNARTCPVPGTGL